MTCTAFAGLVEDCSLRGIPVISATVSEDLLLVTMEGSLARGDSLLKHYGGVFYILADSIASGWPVLGLQVDIPGKMFSAPWRGCSRGSTSPS